MSISVQIDVAYQVSWFEKCGMFKLMPQRTGPKSDKGLHVCAYNHLDNKRIWNQANHLRWRILRKKFKNSSCSLFSQKVPF